MSDKQNSKVSVAISESKSSSNNSSQASKTRKAEYWTKERMMKVKSSPMPKV